MSVSKIYFRGHNSGEFAGVTVASADYGDTELKRADTDLAGRDGSVTSHANGRHYRARQMTIVFNVSATPQTVEGVLSSLREWLSGGVGDLTDDFNAGWVWANADFVSAHTDYIDMFRGFAQLTVKMTAEPRAVKSGTVCRRALKFTDTISGNAAAAIAVNGSTYTLTKSDGTAAAGTLPSGERKYRITCYSENVPAITLGQTAIAPDTVFTLPASGTITVSGAGFAYVELWQDTREVRL